MVNTVLFVLGISMSALGAIFLKLGSSSIGGRSLSLNLLPSILSNKFIVIGFILYFIPALIWVYLLSKLPVSLVHPIIALTYIATPILAIFMLSEPISLVRWVGIVVTVVGVIIVARG